MQVEGVVGGPHDRVGLHEVVVGAVLQQRPVPHRRPLNPVVDHSVVGRPRVADHDPVALAAGPGGQRVLDQVVRDRDEPAELVVNLVVITTPL